MDGRKAEIIKTDATTNHGQYLRVYRYKSIAHLYTSDFRPHVKLCIRRPPGGQTQTCKAHLRRRLAWEIIQVNQDTLPRN